MEGTGCGTPRVFGFRSVGALPPRPPINVLHYGKVLRLLFMRSYWTGLGSFHGITRVMVEYSIAIDILGISTS